MTRAMPRRAHLKIVGTAHSAASLAAHAAADPVPVLPMIADLTLKLNALKQLSQGLRWGSCQIITIVIKDGSVTEDASL